MNETCPFELKTERLILRELNADDAPFMLALLTDPGFLRNVGDRGVHTLDQAREYIIAGAIASYRQHGFGLWAVRRVDDPACIGVCGLIRRETLDDVDIGYALLPEWRGQGYALEASEACMELGQQRFGLQRIVAITSQDNPASVRLLEKLGFRFERLIRFSADTDELCLFGWSARDATPVP